MKIADRGNRRSTVSTIKLVLGAALACLPIAAAQSAETPVPAPGRESPETIEARSRNTNLLLQGPRRTARRAGQIDSRQAGQ
jgi:hypothetical protein